MLIPSVIADAPCDPGILDLRGMEPMQKQDAKLYLLQTCGPLDFPSVSVQSYKAMAALRLKSPQKFRPAREDSLDPKFKHEIMTKIHNFCIDNNVFFEAAFLPIKK